MMRFINHAFALAIVVMLYWMAEFLPNYKAHDWKCATDAECYAEEFATFGTVNGSSLIWESK